MSQQERLHLQSYVLFFYFWKSYPQAQISEIFLDTESSMQTEHENIMRKSYKTST